MRERDLAPPKQTDSTAHKEVMERLYAQIRFPEAIDYWAAHFAEDKLDVAISDARHLDSHRQERENQVWQRYFSQHGRFLDCGCGAGFFMQRLREVIQGDSSIIGIDISRIVLEYAKRRYSYFPFLNADATALPFKKESFDGVLVIGALETMRENLPILKECARVLKAQGVLYLDVHKPFIDPFVFPSIVSKSKCLFIRLLQCVGALPEMKIQTSSHSRRLAEVRRSLMKDFQMAGFELLERGTLLHGFEWGFYKKFCPWAVPLLIRCGRYLNRLPYRYYKNLEYLIWKKNYNGSSDSNC